MKKRKAKTRRRDRMSIEDVVLSPFDREAMKAWHRSRGINAAKRAKRIASFRSPLTSQSDIDKNVVRPIYVPPK